ncbi:retrovirus-related pol polyprotein from transposon TNT 1-94 [Tanacetum coccineum]|uniref:Retrovirus-related pol polyprotein from transposon TNT 1-94 n=1 Tax=Tanacetum coccineum TaxID=301880 RepID=A0ABQ5IW85_9ASTR
MEGTREKLIIDDIIRDKDAQFADFEKKINSLKQTLSKQLKEKESLTKTFNVFKNESKEKEAKNIDNEIALEKKVKELDNIVHKMGQSVIARSDDDEASNHEDASDTGAAPKQKQQVEQVIPQTTVILNIKLPILKKEEYDIWAMEMEHYLEYIDNDVWKVIQNENSKKRILTGKDGVLREYFHQFTDAGNSSWRVRVDGKAPVGFDKKKLECFYCHNTGHFAREYTTKGTHDGKKKRDSFYQHKKPGKQGKE